MSIVNILHPLLRKSKDNWQKWRLTYAGGDEFIRTYLEYLDQKEDRREFMTRLRLSYCPAFAKSAIQEVRNSIYGRMRDVTRSGGSPEYQQAMKGLKSGVDLVGSDMNYFMGVKVLDELITMSMVGIYVDMPADVGLTLAERQGKRPYLYIYNIEDIKSFTYDESSRPSEFSSVLLFDRSYDYDSEYGMPSGNKERYRLLRTAIVEENGQLVQRVFVKFFDTAGNLTDDAGNPLLGLDASWRGYQIGKIDKIPFTLLSIQTSLLADVANYQIAHLNLASSDLWYSIRANFPFYVEQYDARSESPYIKNDDFEDASATTTITTTDSAEVVVGPARGRRYPVGTNQPAFISPPAEPMRLSMEKQEQLKREIRQLVQLALSNLDPGLASAESKAIDKEALQNGLSYVALILQNAENQIAAFWKMYEGRGTIAEIVYPLSYSMLSPEEVDKEVKTLIELAEKVSSPTLKARCAQRIAELKLGQHIRYSELQDIKNEIERSKFPIVDPKTLQLDIESGLVGLEFASQIRGYPEGQVEAAAENHAERLARIQLYQSNGPGSIDTSNAAARGLSDLSANSKSGKEERKAANDQTTSDRPTDPTRGEQFFDKQGDD